MINWINTEMYDKSLNDNKRCIIVIPIYKETLLQTEQLSLKQCVECLGNIYEICLVCPNGLDVTNYKNIVENYHFNYLPCNPEFFNSQSSYSMLCETRQFYECFAKYEYMLIYQLDGWVFVNNDLKKFLDMSYDYIGSPWPVGTFGRNKESVGNGGVSLRKISKFIEICVSINKFDLNSKYAYLEDMFFCNYIPAIKKHIQFNIASVRDAAEFCITAEPSHFVEMNGGKLPMFAHGWNKEYEYDNFWKNCIPVNNFVYRKKNINYYDIYSNKLVNSTPNKKQPVDIFTQWLQANNQDGIAEKNIKAKKLAEARKRAEENAKKEEERKRLEIAEKQKQEEIKQETIQNDIKNKINSVIINETIKYICEDENGNMPIQCFDYENSIIITMTSWTKRINNVVTVLKSIITNNMLPAKIVINLAIEEFPNKENDLPKDLNEYINENNIIEINWLKNNSKVWKKSLPTLIKYPNAWILCIDDDFEYPTNFIETFCNKHNKNMNVPLVGQQWKIWQDYYQHSGCSSLDSMILLKSYINILDEDIYKTGDEDTFMTYCYMKAGLHEKYVDKLFGTNMKTISTNDSYSASNNIIIATDWKLLQQKYDNKDLKEYEKPYIYNNDILICIFNYKHDDNAKKWLHMLSPYFEAVVLDSGNDHEEKEFIQFSNIYYSGLFNEMKKLSEKKNYKWIGMIPSDITLISDIQLLINKIIWLTTTNNIGLWQPSLDKTSRNFGNNIHSDKYKLESKKVLEAHFLFINNEILKNIDYIDTNANTYGFGIAEILSGISLKHSYKNIFDNTIQIHHPNEVGYNISNATQQSSIWTPMQCEKYGLSLPYLINIWNDNNSFGEFNMYNHYVADQIIYNVENKEHPIFVSMTSWKKRIKYVPLMIDYLKKQTVQPDKVFLWLSSDELDKTDVPEKLYNDSFVDIKWVDKNLYVWKRFLTIQQCPNAFVFMMDDDFYYHTTYIEEMLNCAKQHNNKGIICYSCNWCNSKGEPWGGVKDYDNTGKYWLSGGVTLWCPNSFPMEAFDTYETIMSKYDLQCDECYLMPFVYYHETPIYTIEENWKTFFEKTKMIEDSQNTALHDMFFEKQDDFKTNKKNKLLQEVVSQLNEPYRNKFKKIFINYKPIKKLYPENKK